ncbi:hypothetical protein [Paraconexibacter sp.]|uniref:hypothetical protein n=1 Tax=Paraconexibacter sp. TaxID=2949640 RepID=UPI003564BFEA
MSETAFSDIDFEHLVARALRPVDPPANLRERFEQTLTNLADLAGEELEAWELSAMRDPRNWVRPAAATAIGGAAGAALVVLRVRNRQKARLQSSDNALEFVEQTARALAEDAKRLLERR